MEIINYKNKKPIISKDVFIASGAKIIGDVTPTSSEIFVDNILDTYVRSFFVY